MIEIAIVVLCLLANALIAGVEMAFVPSTGRASANWPGRDRKRPRSSYG